MKKVVINLVLVLVGFLIYFLQANFFNWFTIAGVKPNIFVIYVLFIGLFGNKSMGILYGVVCGVFLDLLFREMVGSNLVALVLVGVLSIIFDRNFSKDSRITIMFMVFGSTIVFEVASYFMNYILYSVNVEIIQFIKILLIEVVYNILITIIIYPLIQRCGYFIENEFKGNKILTRYF